jgi:hypothetical protein
VIVGGVSADAAYGATVNVRTPKEPNNRALNPEIGFARQWIGARFAYPVERVIAVLEPLDGLCLFDGCRGHLFPFRASRLGELFKVLGFSP